MSKALRVLFIEDSKGDTLLILHELKSSFPDMESQRVENAEQFENALSREWDVILSDYFLPQFDILEALSIIRRRGLDIPFIVVSGSIGEQMAVDAMLAGACDYVMKDHPLRLPLVIKRELREKQEREARRRLEAQMIQAQKMESIGRLAGGVAHDFNNMLTAILGIAQVAASEMPEGHPLRKDIEEIEKTAKRATQLTRQLLAFSRKQIFEPHVLNLNELIIGLEKMLRRIIGDDIELVVLTAPGLGLVKVDPSQFEQVIVNLAANARDAMPQGGKLTIETSNFEPDDKFVFAYPELKDGEPYVVLSVSDTGLGMTEEVRRQLFEPFFTTKPKDKGTGLGLATSYGIVRQSGGFISAYSEPGKGALFQICVPRVEGEVQSYSAPAPSKNIPRGHETVLLVEDDISVRSLSSRVLKRQGYVMLEAEDGEQALQILRKDLDRKIQLIITDLVMPNISGRQLAEEVRRIRPEIPILFTSGYTEEDVPALFLPKPFTPDVLARKVREVLDNG